MLSNLRPSQIVSLAFLALAAVGLVLRIIAVFRLRAHLRGGASAGESAVPLTLWRAVKRGVRNLDDKLDRLVSSSRDGDQILLGADAGSAEHDACEKLRARFPQRDIVVVPCEPGRAPNPKISKFIQMVPHARLAHWLLTDSEAIPDEAFIESFRREWNASGADVMTAGYRFLLTEDNLPALLDALPAFTTLWPGLMLAGKINFTLGACTALRAEDLRAIGGWETFSSDLAEDHQLGHSLARNGKRIALSRNVLVLDCDEMGMREMLRHQHRVAVTYRCAAPLGTLGMPLLHAWPLLSISMVAALAGHWFGASASFHSSERVEAFRFLAMLAGTAAAAGAVWLHTTLATMNLLGEKSARLAALAMLSSVVESACWLASWFSARVWWAAKWRRVSWRGRLR